MRDPYEVLGLRKGASKEDIKNAYKHLAKQYHPDQYDNNPLRDLAEEKMREINEAYDYLMKNSQDTSSGYTSSNHNYQNNTNYSGSESYETIRVDIDRGNLSSAEQKLNSMPYKDAEWNYLMGILYQRKGWYDSANTYITTAFNLSPSNPKYRNAYNELNHQNHTYRQTYYGRKSHDNDAFDLCIKLWCADSLCECMGGDLITCL